MHTSEVEQASGAAPGLVLGEVTAGYGKVTVLRDVSLEVGPGEVAALIGPNGAGKTTMLSAISGLNCDVSSGVIRFDGQEITGAGSRRTTSLGIAHVLEGHRVFPELSVLENLEIGTFGVPRVSRKEAIDDALSNFPELAERLRLKAGKLSGGQQQMLVVAQALVKRPKLLMLDEPSAGLSPVLVDRILQVCRALAADGTSVLIVEQAVEKVLAASDRAHVLVAGEVRFSGKSSELANADEVMQAAYFG